MERTERANSADAATWQAWRGSVSAHAAQVVDRTFARRGNHTEVHLRRCDLAVVVEAALATDPARAALEKAIEPLANVGPHGRCLSCGCEPEPEHLYCGCEPAEEPTRSQMIAARGALAAARARK